MSSPPGLKSRMVENPDLEAFEQALVLGFEFG